MRSLIPFWLLLSLVFSAGGCMAHRQPFQVDLEVDFGPAGKPPIHRTVEVPWGATSDILLARVCSVQKGAACCNPKEVAGIDGVAINPMTNRWWTVAINGSKKVSPYRTKLKPGDTVRWEYRSYDQ